MQDWPHQVAAQDQALAAFARGERRVCLSIPTGGGKTRVACKLCESWLEQGLKVAVYSNRKLLIEQLSRVLARHGLDHGVRAAGWSADDAFFDLQVCSVQTEGERVFKRGVWQLHDADRVIVDEAHLLKEKTAQKILEAHYQAGASYLGLTATPLGIGYLYDTLLQVGTMAELRACGALVRALHYAPDEPDLRVLKNRPAVGDDLSEQQNHQVMMTPSIFGRVSQHFFRLNPEQKPTILFGPDVEGSLWFAEQFSFPEKRHPSLQHLPAVPAAHMDGQDVWVHGRLERSNRALRNQVIDDFRVGKIKVLCHRFILREGIDIPEAEVGILATVFGSVQSYLQSGGRLLRASSGKERAIIIDHGGNYWRHGSLNADREWELEYTPAIFSGLRADRLRSKKCRRCGEKLAPGNPWCPKCSLCNEIEPTKCPECDLVLVIGKCPGCGWQGMRRQSRHVVAADGILKEISGDIFVPRRITRRPDGKQLWERMYYRALSQKWDATFRQAEAMFAQENYWGWPDRSWPLMPRREIDFFRKVVDVPVDRLHGSPECLEEMARYRHKVGR